MRAIIMMAVLTLMSASAGAQDWIKLGNDYEGDEYFVSTRPPIKSGAMARQWTHVNRIKPKISGYEQHLSVRNFIEIDCRERKYRILQQTLFSMRDMMGQVVRHSPNPGPWDYISINSFGEIYLSYFCTNAR